MKAAGAVLWAILASGCAGEEAASGADRSPAAQGDSAGSPSLSPPAAREVRRQATERATEIEAAADEYATVGGSDQAGEVKATFTAYLDGGTVRLIREREDAGDYGHSDNEYYFEDGALFYYVAGGLSRTRGGGEHPTTDAVVLRLYFDREARLQLHEKTLNGAPVPLDGYEESTVRRRAEALHQAALSGGVMDPAVASAASGPVEVEFAPGSSTGTFAGRIVARETSTYVVTAEEGQTLSASLETASRFAHFIVQYGGQAVFDSGRKGERAWREKLPREGEFVVRVYLVRAEANRGGAAEYELTIGLEDEAAPEN